ncbi:MAG: hypothetical protein GY810_21705 [Aureispira sp.]|nr:hypothetical protein [Aureispira sp.]
MLNLQIDDSQLDVSFDHIATDLFQNYDLRIGNSYYQLAEIEFYYNKFDKDKALDNFAHQHGEKNPNGTWRLHGAGLDIVFKKLGDYYGGILIRGLQPLDSNRNQATDNYIDGPWNTATTCISKMGMADANSGFELVKRAKIRQTVFKKSPRVGLRLRQAQDLRYIGKPWRYLALVGDTPVIKTKKYRHWAYLQQRHNEGETEANKLWEHLYNRKNYWKEFKVGQTMSPQAFVNLKLTTGNTCRMLGCYIKNYTEA